MTTAPETESNGGFSPTHMPDVLHHRCQSLGGLHVDNFCGESGSSERYSVKSFSGHRPRHSFESFHEPAFRACWFLKEGRRKTHTHAQQPHAQMSTFGFVSECCLYSVLFSISLLGETGRSHVELTWSRVMGWAPGVSAPENAEARTRVDLIFIHSKFLFCSFYGFGVYLACFRRIGFKLGDERGFHDHPQRSKGSRTLTPRQPRHELVAGFQIRVCLSERWTAHSRVDPSAIELPTWCCSRFRRDHPAPPPLKSYLETFIRTCSCGTGSHHSPYHHRLR